MSAKKEYYINTFNFFYVKNEKLGDKFSMSATGDRFGSESDNDTLDNVLIKISKGYRENEKEFIDAHIDIGDLINGVLKRQY